MAAKVSASRKRLMMLSPRHIFTNAPEVDRPSVPRCQAITEESVDHCAVGGGGERRLNRMADRCRQFPDPVALKHWLYGGKIAAQHREIARGMDDANVFVWAGSDQSSNVSILAASEIIEQCPIESLLSSV